MALGGPKQGVALMGRNYDEYRDMFRLSDFDRNDRILDVASGVSSFRGEATALGYTVRACDRVYGESAASIKKKAAADLKKVMGGLDESFYRWDGIADLSALRRRREVSLDRFADDYASDFASGRGDYVKCVLPSVGFDDGEFCVALVSHLLFLYDDRLDYDFHRRAVFELLRVASREVRIFPLVNFRGERSQFVRRIIYDALDAGYGVSIDRVPYEFAKNANQMLRILKN